MATKNRLALPRLKKIVLNSGTGKARENQKMVDEIRENLALISGQKPKITRAKKAIAGFKVRLNDEVGLVVTLRGSRMDNFAHKLAKIVLPRMRDFRGLSDKGFDYQGNYTLGIPEEIVFPEISNEKSEILHGLSVSIVTTAKNPKEGRMLLEELGFPFKRQ